MAMQDLADEDESDPADISFYSGDIGDMDTVE
jgi:hypothetical protein